MSATNDTADLLGLPVAIVVSLGRHLSHVEYLKHVTALLELKKQETKDDYNSDLFKRRSKAIDRYRAWVKDFENENKTK